MIIESNPSTEIIEIFNASLFRFKRSEVWIILKSKIQKFFYFWFTISVLRYHIYLHHTCSHTLLDLHKNG